MKLFKKRKDRRKNSELSIGEEFIYNDQHLICIEKEEDEDCSGCAFLIDDDCTAPLDLNCYSAFRKDEKNVFFVEI